MLESETAARKVSASTVQATGIAAAIVHTVAARGLVFEPDPEMWTMLAEALVEDPACLAGTAAGQVLEVELSDCVFSVNRLRVSGSLSFTVSLVPLVLTVDFNELDIEDDLLSGVMTLSGASADQSAAMAALDVRYLATGDRLTFEQLEIALHPTSFAFTGDGALSGRNRSDGIELRAMSWDHGRCLPSGGDMAYFGTRVDVRFLDLTPADGFAELVRRSSAFDSQLFVPCR